MTRTPEKSAEGPVVRLGADRAEEVVDVLFDSFRTYPVMRYIVGERRADYDALLRRLIGIFVSARALRGDPIFAIEEAGRAIAVATTTPPGARQAPPSVQETREALLQEIGSGAKERSEQLVAIWERTTLPVPQVHLNMLGVVGARAGRGLGGRLLRHVHEMSRLDPVSTGVSLTTEDPRNVPLYRHCGYEIVSHDRVTADLETWSFFRKDEAEGPRSR